MGHYAIRHPRHQLLAEYRPGHILMLAGIRLDRASLEFREVGRVVVEVA